MKNILSASTNCYHGYPLDTCLDHIASAGFEYVEVLSLPPWAEDVPLKATDSMVAGFLDRVSAHGLRIFSLGGQADLGSDSGVENARSLLRLTVAMGLSAVGVGVGPLGPTTYDPTVGEPFYTRFPGLLDEASKIGVKTISIENRGPLIQTGAQAREAIERIGNDAVRILYDTANTVFFGGVRPEDEIDAVIPFMACMHLKDKAGASHAWDFPELGTGYLDLRKILSRCIDAGYAGPIVVELEFQGDPWPPLEEIDAALTRSRSFVLNILSASAAAM